VPAIGWYAWKKAEQLDPATGELTMTEQPCFVRMPDRQPFAFAGVMSRRFAEGNQPEFSCAILTREAIGPVAQICDRMPIVLPKNAHAAWLDRELTDAAIVIDFAREQAETEFIHHAIGVRHGFPHHGNADFDSGGLAIQNGNAPSVLDYGRPDEEARATDDVKVVNIERAFTHVSRK
jgi:hypothetical protein